jgi:uncharacterized protein (TIGR02611 family)
MTCMAKQARATYQFIRKIIAAVIGIPIIIIGIILIPLPGPGLLICFVGFFILSLEFDWAQPYVQKAKKQLGAIVQHAKEQSDKIAKD